MMSKLGFSERNWDSAGPGLADPSKKILFVCGPARGGTTLLGLILDRCFDYGTGAEGTFIDQFAKRLGRYGDLTKADNFARLANDLAQCDMLQIERRKTRPPRRDVTPQMILEHAPERSYAGAVYAIFDCMAELQSKGRVGNKNPDYWRYFPLLDGLFPEQAKHVCIVRDGRDVALSNNRLSWGLSSVYASAVFYRLFCRTLNTYAQAAPPGRIIILRYEDFLNEPQDTFRQLRDFLDPTMPDSYIDSAVAYIAEQGKPNQCEKWRKEMSEEDCRIFEALAGPELAQHGYPLQFDDARISILTHLRFRLREYWRLVKLNLKLVWQQVTRQG